MSRVRPCGAFQDCADRMPNGWLHATLGENVARLVTVKRLQAPGNRIPSTQSV